MAAPTFFRLTIPSIVVSLLLLAVSVGTGVYIHGMQRNISAQLHADIIEGREARDLETALLRTRNRVNQYMITHDETYLDEAQAAYEEVHASLDRVAHQPRSEATKALVESMESAASMLGKRLSAMVASRRPPDEDLRALTESPLTNPLIEQARLLVESKRAEIDRATTDNQRLTDWLAGGLIVLGVCGAAAGLASGIMLARRINRAVVELNLSMRDTAGTLDSVLGPFELGRNVNLDELPASLQQLTSRVTEVVEQLQASQLKMLRAEQLAAVGQLAAGLAHEMRNPLTAMRFIVQACMARGDAAGLEKRNLDVLDEEIRRLDHMIQMFLDFARPVEPSRSSVPAHDALQRVAQLMESRAQQQGVNIVVDGGAQPLVIWADDRQLHQVLINLVQNALDVLESGGTVWLRARPTKRPRDARGKGLSGDGWISLEVADDGPGIDPQVLPRLFEPFVSTKDTGVGLGLSICKKIVESHGGTIEVAARTGGGSLATVRLPAAAEPVAAPVPSTV